MIDGNQFFKLRMKQLFYTWNKIILRINLDTL